MKQIIDNFIKRNSKLIGWLLFASFIMGVLLIIAVVVLEFLGYVQVSELLGIIDSVVMASVGLITSYVAKVAKWLGK